MLQIYVVIVLNLLELQLSLDYFHSWPLESVVFAIAKFSFLVFVLVLANRSEIFMEKA